jgi:hypothetical protein
MRNLALLLAILVVLLPASSVEAECIIGVFADAAGTETVYWPTQFQWFDFYVVLWDEAAVEGVSYNLITPPELVIGTQEFSPDGIGFQFVTPGGDIIGFGECAFGFGGQSILVAHYSALWTSPTGLPSFIRLEPNVTENPAAIVYATCSELVEECPNVQDLYLTYGAPVESRSFGAVKSLF